MVTYTLTPEQRVRKSIITLQDKQPFFAHLALACELYRIDNEEQMLKVGMPYPTFGVNARGHLFFHVDAVNERTPDEVLGTVMHEVGHIAFEHPSSLGGRDITIANYAQDIVINMIVWSNGFVLHKNSVKVDVRLDEGYVYFDKDGKQKITVKNVTKKCWQDVYEELLKQWPQEPTCPNCGGTIGDESKDESGDGAGGKEDEKDGNGQEQDGSGKGKSKQGKGHKHGGKEPCQCGDWHDYGSADSMSPKEKQQMKEYWQNRVTEAATIAKQRGIVPKGMDRIVDELMKPKVMWKDILKKRVKKYMVPVDLAYHRMHKKSHQLGVYLPGQIKETREIEVIVDTSGSIGGSELTEFLSEIVGMAKSNNRIKMGVTFVDCAVHNHYDIANGNIAKIMAMTPQGGGGTEMEVGLDWVKANKPKVPVVIVLTDGFDSYRKSRKDYPFEVIWCLSAGGMSIEDHKATYGMKIKIER